MIARNEQRKKEKKILIRKLVSHVPSTKLGQGIVTSRESAQLPERWRANPLYRLIFIYFMATNPYWQASSRNRSALGEPKWSRGWCLTSHLFFFFTFHRPRTSTLCYLRVHLPPKLSTFVIFILFNIRCWTVFNAGCVPKTKISFI